MDELIVDDITTNTTYVLHVDEETAARAREDAVFATVLLQEHLQNQQQNSQSQVFGSCSTQRSEELESGKSRSECTQKNQSWTHAETIELISAYDIFKDDLNHAKKKQHVWTNISTLLETKGIKKTEIIIKTKWKNLLRTYKAIKDCTNRTGRGTVRFQFMSEMDNILGDRPLVSSPNAVGVGVNDAVEENVEVPSASQNVETSVENDNSAPNTQKQEKTFNAVSLKRKYWKLKMEELQEKRLNRQKYMEMVIEEKHKKQEREEKLMKLREKELEIEERKVKALEAFAYSNKDDDDDDEHNKT